MILINFMLIYLNLCSKKDVFRVELYDLIHNLVIFKTTLL